MLINLWTDNAYFLLPWQNKIYVPHRDFDSAFPEQLFKLIEQWNKEFFVINGTWSFSTLRLGALVINMMKRIFKDDIILHEIDKFSLYSKVFANSDIARQILINIWQKQNYILFDRVDDVKSIVKISDIQNSSNFYMDSLENCPMELLDTKKIEIDFIDNQSLSVWWVVVNANWIFWDVVEFVVPNYFLEPNIW
jgi:hypothetical protein